MANVKTPERAEAAAQDKWDLSKLFADEKAWEAGLARYEKLAERVAGFKGTLAGSAQSLAEYLEFLRDFWALEQDLACYAELRQCEDEGSSQARAMTGRILMAQARAQAALSWATPEIQAIPDADIAGFLQDARLADFVVYLKKLLRWKPFVLGESEERIIALQSEADGIAGDAFSVLTNVDMDFGVVETTEGRQPLTQSTYSVFMENPDRNVRKNAYTAFYSRFEANKTTLAALYGGSVKNDVIKARIRGFNSAREAALFPDNVGVEVYDNLISTINANLAPLHRYYSLRKRALGLESLRHWDVYAPIVPKAAKKTSWNEAVETITAALAPLGSECAGTLRNGLLGGWADRYENKGKRSGAFSSGSYSSDPYILMNYKEDSVRDIFTLVHEGGHSMHSWYSIHSNPFMQYSYTIFEAEVASTFNEELLYRHLLKNAPDKELKRYIVNKRLDDILATLYRQTMFAEYEKRTHELEEAGMPLTVDVLRSEYRALLQKYFGADMILEAASDMEGLRIPHFYRAFYVYKYSTGISASLALAERVLQGGASELADYFKFLRSGGSRFPIESLKIAGVDMSKPEPIAAACRSFDNLVTELEGLL